MLTTEEKELLIELYNSSENNAFQSNDPEFINKNLDLIFGLVEERFIRETHSDGYESLVVFLQPKAIRAIKNNFKNYTYEEKSDTINISGNNNVINHGNISNSFNTDSLNQSIKELKNSDEPEELKQIILNAYQEHNELLQQTIADIKNSTTRQSKLDIVKSFIKNVKATVQDVKALLNMFLNYF